MPTVQGGDSNWKEKQIKFEIKILQINLNKCRLAQDLLEGTVERVPPDVIMIAEQNKSKSKNYWFKDCEGDAAIWITSKGIARGKDINIVKQGIGMVAISYNNYLKISSNISPNIDDNTVDGRLDEIADIIKAKKWAGVILAGDFNSKSPLWGGRMWNPNLLDRTINTCCTL